MEASPLLYWIREERAAETFPPVTQALDDPNGLLAVGGDLSPERLLDAYRRGIFPWYTEGQPILWWSPAPRAVFRTDGIHLSRSLRRRINQQHYRVTANEAFSEVMHCCGEARGDGCGTWITPAMAVAYERLHRLGHAASVEVWLGDALVGGIYGVRIGAMFFGESMFSRATDASKVALLNLGYNLKRWGGLWIDAQVESAHLMTMGAELVPRESFLALLAGECARALAVDDFRQDFHMLEAASAYPPKPARGAAPGGCA